MQAHLRSAASRCFGVWSPAPPPSARIASGLSGTARTLRRETRWSRPVTRASNAPECPPALVIPCSTCRWLMVKLVRQAQQVRRLQDLRHLPDCTKIRSSVCICLQGNRPKPDATASRGRDVTARVSEADTFEYCLAPVCRRGVFFSRLATVRRTLSFYTLTQSSWCRAYRCERWSVGSKL